jgi:hypothetical protein
MVSGRNLEDSGRRPQEAQESGDRAERLFLRGPLALVVASSARSKSFPEWARWVSHSAPAIRTRAQAGTRAHSSETFKALGTF